MAEQAQLAAQLTTFKADLTRVTEEIVRRLTDLKTAVDNADDVSPELQAAADALVASVQSLDDLAPPITDPPTP